MAQYWVLNKKNVVPTSEGFPPLNISIPDNMASISMPKLKFNFTIEFHPRVGAFPELGSIDPFFMSFQLKTATRPNPTVSLQDVNFYNYRSKLETKIEYGTVTVSFYDDPFNNAHSLFSKYFEIRSPVFSQGKEQADNLDREGFNGAGSIGPLPNSARNGIFRAITLAHQYQLAGVAKQTKYEYLNPKIQSVELEEMDMSMSETTMVRLTFAYDGVKVIEE
jgi:hypothetical protein